MDTISSKKINPYLPSQVAEKQSGQDSAATAMVRQIAVIGSLVLALLTGGYGLVCILYVVGLLSAPMPQSVSAAFFPKLSIILLLSSVSTFVSILAAFRWHRKHAIRGFIYNLVAILVIVGPLTVIPFKLLVLK